MALSSANYEEVLNWHVFKRFVEYNTYLKHGIFQFILHTDLSFFAATNGRVATCPQLQLML
jgi:hypothetical protein